ncbi:hypothetical protein MMC25_007679 [Agyrium rufum]|nr:hypothetical protein [Agyrium rufum]
MPYPFPAELIDQIISCLKPPALKAVRLTNKVFHDIATKWLSREVRLILTIRSFERLQLNFMHPYISVCVRKLVFEGYLLAHYPTLGGWASAVLVGGFVSDSDLCTIMVEIIGSYNTSMVGWDEPSPTKSSLINRAWNSYKTMYEEQQEIEDRSMDHRETGRAIRRFVNLQTICLSIDQEPWEFSHYLKVSYASTLVLPRGEHHMASKSVKPPRLRQWHSLMLGLPILDAFGAEQCIKKNIPLRAPCIHKLHLGSVSWFVFSSTPAHLLKAISYALSHLREFRITLTTGRDSSGISGIDSTLCREKMGTGCLRDFLNPM